MARWNCVLGACVLAWMCAMKARAADVFVFNVYSGAGCTGSSGGLPIGFSECINLASLGYVCTLSRAGVTVSSCNGVYAPNRPGCTEWGSFSVGFKTVESGANAQGQTLMATSLYWAGCTTSGETCASDANRVPLAVGVVGACLNLPTLTSDITKAMASALGVTGATGFSSFMIVKQDVTPPKLPLGAIIGGAVGGLLVITLIILGYMYTKKRGPFIVKDDPTTNPERPDPAVMGNVNPMVHKH